MFCWRNDYHPVLKQIRPRSAWPSLMRSGQRMAAHETSLFRHAALNRPHQIGFGAAGVRDQGMGIAVLGNFTNVIGDLIHGCTDNHEIGGGHASGKPRRRTRDGSGLFGDLQGIPSPTDTNYVLCQTSSARGQANRATDQSDADNSQGVPTILHRNFNLRYVAEFARIRTVSNVNTSEFWRIRLPVAGDRLRPLSKRRL
jgi:hypothetical protein